MTCLPRQTGALRPARIQGTVLSILFALAASRAPALQGLRKRVLGAGLAGWPGWVEDARVEGWLGSLLGFVLRRDGVSKGEEKERR